MATLKSKIILCKGINIDKNYVNVLNYTEEQMLSLCQSQEHLVAYADDYSFIRNRGTISTNFKYDDALQSNYISFQNKDYSNKWFFAWIDEVNFIGEENTEIKYTIDVWSTWFSYWNTKTCFINRQHVNDDTIGLHTIPENLDVGEVIQERQTEDESYGNEYGYWVAIASNWLIKDNSTGDESADSDKGTQYAGITIYDNTVFGTQIILFRIQSLEDFKDLYLYIARSNKDGHVEDIQNMFIVPDVAIDQTEINVHRASIGDLTQYPNNGFDFYTIDYDMEPATFNTVIEKLTTFNDYTPKNNKCFVYPYNYLFVSNNQGSNNIYKYEDFTTPNCVFENQFSISIGGSGRIVQLSYKGMSTNDDEALPLGKYPTCAWSSDAYTNWLTQNSVNIATNLATLAGGTALSVATGGLATPAVAGGLALSTAGSIANTIGQFYQANLLPNISSGQATGDVIWTANRNKFTFRQMRVKTEYLKIIDDYFTRFGYAIRSLGMPNITGRRYWNYVEIGSTEEIGYGDVPSQYMEIINQACRKGVTIWHNHENIGNYALDNTIV